MNPKDILLFRHFNEHAKSKKKQSRKKKVKKNQTNAEVFIVAKQNNYTDDSVKTSNWKTLQELRRISMNEDNEHDHLHVSKDGYFCGTPGCNILYFDCN